MIKQKNKTRNIIWFIISLTCFFLFVRIQFINSIIPASLDNVDSNSKYLLPDSLIFLLILPVITSISTILA